eukprot:scaffold21746_cov21-Tisochrysis_lutea.AAC.1
MVPALNNVSMLISASVDHCHACCQSDYFTMLCANPDQCLCTELTPSQFSLQKLVQQDTVWVQVVCATVQEVYKRLQHNSNI